MGGEGHPPTLAARGDENEEVARLRDEAERVEAVDLDGLDDPLARQSAIEAAGEAATGRSKAGRPGQRGAVA